MIAPELDVIEEICSAKNVPSSERVFLGRVGDKFVVVVTSYPDGISVSVISCDDRPCIHVGKVSRSRSLSVCSS
jgi:hypothetical protein